MRKVTLEAEPIIDIWPYVDAIPDSDLGDLTAHDVEHVYRDANGRYDHVLIATCKKNVHLAIVVDRHDPNIVGHHILDLNQLYGIGNPL
jgi:hypothetical protein